MGSGVSRSPAARPVGTINQIVSRPERPGGWRGQPPGNPLRESRGDTAMMTADEIRSQRFGAQPLRGFNSKEVLAFLDDVAEAYEDLQKMNIALAHAAREAQVIRPPEVLPGAEAQAESRSKTAEEKRSEERR